MAFKAFPRNSQEIENDGKNSILTSLKTGVTTIRVMPAYSDRGCWYKKINEYYFKLGDQHMYFPSPRDFGNTDPIWDYCDSVYEEGDPQAIEKVKAWRPRLRYLVNVFILSEPNPVDRNGLVVLKLPAKVQKELRTYDVDQAAGFGDITNLETGINFNVKKEGTGINTTYTVTPHRQSTNIKDLLKERNLNLDSMVLHNLDVVYPTKALHELKEILDTLRSEGVVTQTEQNTTNVPNIRVEGNNAPSGTITVETTAPPEN